MAPVTNMSYPYPSTMFCDDHSARIARIEDALMSSIADTSQMRDEFRESMNRIETRANAIVSKLDCAI